MQILIDFFAAIGILLLLGFGLGVFYLIGHSMTHPPDEMDIEQNEDIYESRVSAGLFHMIGLAIVSMLSSAALVYKVFFQLAT